MPARAPGAVRRPGTGAGADAGDEAAGAGGPGSIPGFTVALPQFEGPFDLLLALIARRRLDVTELALAEVTDEFMIPEGVLSLVDRMTKVTLMTGVRLWPRTKNNDAPENT